MSFLIYVTATLKALFAWSGSIIYWRHGIIQVIYIFEKVIGPKSMVISQIFYIDYKHYKEQN